ncbi:MAG: PilZ domain-containing protein [Pseudomonadota bacterium]
MSKRDARRYRRISLNLPAQIVVNTVDHYEGELLNISPGDMAIIADTKAVPGDAVVVRIKGLDVIEGTVARTLPDGFAVSFLLSKKRRTLLTEKLMLLSNQAFSAGLEDRRATPRHRNSNSRTVCRLEDGTALYVKILDVSVDGVAVDAPRRPAVGSAIHIGRQRGVIVRHTPRGFVVFYETMQEERPQPILRAV